MTARRAKRVWIGLLFAAVLATCVASVPVQAAEFDDPIFLFRPLRPEDPEGPREPPPAGDFEGPCGIAVNSTGNFFVSDYHHHAIDAFGPSKGYGSQIAGVEPLTPAGLPPEKDDKPVDGPCGLAFDGADVLYANIYHRSVVKFPTFPMEAKLGTVITGGPVDGAHPTGIGADTVTNNVFVNNRTFISVFDSSGVALGSIGAGNLGDSYGLAVSQYPATQGRLYVPDAASNTVKVFSPTVGTVSPIATIDGHDTPNGHFVSLRDAAIAVDRVSGEVYIADNLEPEDTERPETAIHVFTSSGAYEGRLKYNIVNAWPPGLAVDNSPTPTQGRVYVTTENSERAAIFAYPPGAATDKAVPALPLPPQKTGEITEEPWEGDESFAATLAPASVSAVAAVTSAAGPESTPAVQKAKPRRARHRRRSKKRNGRQARNVNSKRNGATR
jgi:DNA-binding beta-propeller fold protein YncE